MAVVLLAGALLASACAPALAQGAGSAGPRGFADRVQDAASRVAGAALPLALLAAGVLLVVNPRAAARLAGLALLAAFLITGGWRLLAGLVRDLALAVVGR
jgi:hypothetical protein